MTTAAIATFEPYNITLNAGTFDTVEISKGGPVGGFPKTYVSADSFVIFASGAVGDYVGIRIDSDTLETFRIPTGQVVQIFAPVSKKIYVSNDSDATVSVSIAFIRGRNHY